MPSLFDSHAHLQEPEFEADLQAVLQRARDSGVDAFLVPAVDLDTARSGLQLASAHEGVYTTAGYHPHEASRFDAEAMQAIGGLLSEQKVVAVGEIGLDYFRMHSPRETQLRTFEQMLDLAEQRTMPVVVHCRDAWEDMQSILGGWAERVSGRFGGQPLGVMHYFTGTLEAARSYIASGFLISIHTSVTHPKAASLRDTVSRLPLDSLLIETDSPYGAPQAFRGRRNEPAYVIEAAKAIAETQGVSFEAVADATAANARRLFRLPLVAPSGGGVR